MGVNILPRLAATVWSTTTVKSFSSRPAMVKRVTVKGTKVTRETSLVMTMEPKKHKNTRAVHSWR